LFLANCGLLAHGAQTVLLSQWPVGGLSTLEITREFIQELPHLTAADAWQRSVQLAHELPVDAETEQRVQAKPEDPPLTAAHPFFWGGYLLLDISGTSGLDPAAPGAALPATDKPERSAP
jgi:CHAT domain-containing protein